MDTEPLFALEEDFEAFLAEKIDAGIPVIVDWVDWGGHWQVIIGFDTAYLLADKYPWVAPFGFPYGLAADYSTPSDVYDYWFSEDFVTDCKMFKSWAGPRASRPGWLR